MTEPLVYSTSPATGRDKGVKREEKGRRGKQAGGDGGGGGARGRDRRETQGGVISISVIMPQQKAHLSLISLHTQLIKSRQIFQTRAGGWGRRTGGVGWSRVVRGRCVMTVAH